MRSCLLALSVALLSFIPCHAQERGFTLTLSETQLNYVGKLLGRQPYEEVAPLIQRIQEQVNSQVAAQSRPPPQPKPEEPKQ